MTINREDLMRLRIFIALFMLGALSGLYGCSATGPRFDLTKTEAVSSKESQLYIFRESAFIESGTYPVVLLDGKEIGDLRNGGYITTKLTPGPHELLVQSGGMLRGQWIHSPKRLSFATEPGKRHYIQVSLRTINTVGNTMYRGVVISIVPDSEALKALSELNLSK